MSNDSPIKKVLKLFKSDPEFADAVCDRFFQRVEQREIPAAGGEPEETNQSERETQREEMALVS